MKREGTSLVEMLTVLAVLAVISFPLSHLWVAIVRDIPRAGDIIYKRAELNRVLNYMHKDINRAVAFPARSGELVSDYRTMLVHLPDELICYGLDDDRIIRYVRVDSNWREDMRWKIPKGVVRWRMLRDSNNKTYAVALLTHIEQRNNGVMEKKLADCRLCFIGARPEPEK